METKRKSAKVAVSFLALAGLAVFSLFAVGGSLEPSAPPGPTMKTLDEVEPRIPIHASDLPLTITEPNSYYLVEDVNFEPNDVHAITIECNDVTVDLMGYTLRGPDSGIKSGIYMYRRTNVEICNGTIRDFGYSAINEVGGYGSSHRVINIRALSSTHGIRLDGYGHLIKDCTAEKNSYSGIYAHGYGCTVTGNTAYSNGSDGILTYRGGTVTGNTARDNTKDGIEVYYDCKVMDNTCNNNGHYGDGAGIHVGGSRNRIEGNQVTFNDWGIDVDDVNNLIVKNSAAGNTTEYDIVANNKVGTISFDPTTAGPWDNFDF